MSFGSNVSSNIFGCLFLGSVSLFICSVRFVLYCTGSGVNSVVVVLEVLSDNYFRIVQLYIWCKYGWTCVCAVLMFVCVESMVMSSA